MSQQIKIDCSNEAKILNTLDHPNIVKYYDSFLEKNNLNIIMEFCDGGDLAGLMKNN